VTQELESEVLHTLKNQLGIAAGFIDLMLDETAAGDPRRDDLLQVQQAMQKALELIPGIARQMR
jgi:hypothetical protein